MNISEGLKSYEIVLLIMGVLLFLTLLFVLICLILQKRAYKGLLLFFVFPIVMVGFPGIQKIKFDNGVIEVETLTATVEQDPTNVEAKNQLEVQLKAIGNRSVSKPSTLKIMEKAYMAVGDTPKAIIYRDRLLPVK
jgi:hypothetical protein